MGTDDQLAGWQDIQRYFEQVAAMSDRVKLVDAGPTTDGNRMIAALISAPENIRRLDEIKAANQRLSDPRTLSAAEAQRLMEANPVVLAIGSSIHATEVGATQTANEILYRLTTATDPGTASILRNVVVILLPSLNPDGHKLVVEWHNRTKDTPFEGASLPWPSHKYVGHDINRDAFMLNMAENQSLARFFYFEWHPQVFLTMHQMGAKGPRFFVPPNYDPIAPNYDPIIWREAGLLGYAMALEMEHDGRSGVVSNALFDYYWPGYEDSAPLGHNTVCLLTEVASANLAGPITVTPAELVGSPRGLPDYRPQLNFPNPWPGGTWRLRDIVDYELSAVRGLLGGVSRYRGELLDNFYEMGKRAIEAGSRGSPFAFVIPPEQHDPRAAAKLANLLIEGRIEVRRALEPFRADGEAYPAGTDIVLMAQPFRAYAKTLLERQRYPTSRTGVGTVERPYDVAGWTLPYQMGVDVRTIERTFEVPAMSRLDRARVAPASVWGETRPSYYLVDARGNGGALAVNRLLAANVGVSWTVRPQEAGGYIYASGSLVVPESKQARTIVAELANDLGLRASGLKGKQPAGVVPLQRARVGLYKPWVENVDEGWTRWLLEQYQFPFRTVMNDDVRRGNLRAQFEAIILPSAPPDSLFSGHLPGTMPPEFVGGLGDEGIAALRAFVQAGGTLICLDASGELAINMLQLPIRDVTREPTADRFFCPGSILKLELDETQPLAFGMPRETSAFFSYSPAYELERRAGTSDGHGGPAATDNSVHVIGKYPSSDLLLSGWIQDESIIANRAAVVEVRSGLGRVVLIGFRAQHRGQSLATFRLLFNAILTSK